MSRALSLAGFQLTLIGRFWVTPEAGKREPRPPHRCLGLPRPQVVPFDQEREYPSCVLSSLRNLFLAQKLQPSHSQELAHSFTHATNLTPAFPCTSPLFVRSFASVRKSTPLLSCAYALFCKNMGYSGIEVVVFTTRLTAMMVNSSESPTRTRLEFGGQAAVSGPHRRRRERNRWMEVLR